MNALSISPSVEDQAFTCWLRGVGVAQARDSIKRVCGAEVSKDAIRHHFAKFAKGAVL